MYVCNCNGLTERDVERAIDAGGHTASDVLARCGWEPGCGKCVRDVQAMLRERQTGRHEPGPARLRPAFA